MMLLGIVLASAFFSLPAKPGVLELLQNNLHWLKQDFPCARIEKNVRSGNSSEWKMVTLSKRGFNNGLCYVEPWIKTSRGARVTVITAPSPSYKGFQQRSAMTWEVNCDDWERRIGPIVSLSNEKPKMYSSWHVKRHGDWYVSSRSDWSSWEPVENPRNGIEEEICRARSLGLLD